MKIKKLELKNFRGFEDLTIDFPEGESGLAVFVGVNGAGKSSILDSIVNLLNAFLLDLTRQERKGKVLSKSIISMRGSDVRQGAKESKSFIHLEFLGVETNVEDNVQAVGGSFKMRSGDYVNFLENNIKEIKSRLNFNFWINAPVICYYPPDRKVGNPVLKIINVDETKPWTIYNNSLDSTLDYSNFFKWFRSMEDFENEQRLYENKDYRHYGLEAVRQAITRFIPYVQNPRVRRQPKEELIIEKKGQEFLFTNLSHGERGLIALVADIARHLSIVKPRPQDLFESKGVVIIDEIEQHLHPEWQRKVIPWLRETFPNIQFILTTHSPQVLSTLKKENVFILEDFKLVKDTPHTFGRDSNAILWDIFGVEKRPPEAKEEFAKLYRIMDDPEKVGETADMLQDVEAKYGYYDEEVVRARGHFQFLNEA